jgi:hypothetical protein
MKRTAAIWVLVAALAGCTSPEHTPGVCDACLASSTRGGIAAGMPAAPGRDAASAQLPQQPSAARRGDGVPEYLPPTAARPLTPCPTIQQALRPVERLPSPGNSGGPDSGSGLPIPTFGGVPAGLMANARPQRLPGATPPPPGVPAAMGLPPVQQVGLQDQAPGRVDVPVVNSKRLSLNYEVKDAGPLGVAGIELWFTENGKPWQKHDASSGRQPPYTVEVKDDGLYGFTLVARNASGASKPPGPNDTPQVLVEVDTTVPKVRLLSIKADAPAPEAQSLTILWTASDKNLGPQPIALSWARDASGPWLPIISQLENTGRYVWRLPQGLPPQFLVRVEAADLAGNVGTDQTPAPLTLDRSQPTVLIRGVETPDQKQKPRMPTLTLTRPAEDELPPVKGGIGGLEPD